MLKVEPFHGHSERLAKQELYAHVTLIALTRVFADETERGFRAAPRPMGMDSRQPVKQWTKCKTVPTASQTEA